MRVLDAAIAEEQWELVSLYLLVGMLKSTLSIPEEALPGLLEVLEGESDG